MINPSSGLMVCGIQVTFLHRSKCQVNLVADKVRRMWGLCVISSYVVSHLCDSADFVCFTCGIHLFVDDRCEADLP